MNAEQLRRKEAKQAFKNRQKIEQSERDFVKRQTDSRILSGIMEGENIIPPDYPVYYGYLYVVELDNGNGTVIQSDIASSAEQLLRLLKTHTPTAKNLRRCNIAARNLF